MRFYKQPHAFYAGIDLHARSMFTHILDHAGAPVFERDLPANTNSQYNHPPLTARLCYPRNRSDDIADRFTDPATQLSVRADLKLIDDFDAQIDDIERVVQKTAKIDDPVSLGFLRTIPGIGVPRARPHTLGLAAVPWTEVSHALEIAEAAYVPSRHRIEPMRC